MEPLMQNAECSMQNAEQPDAVNRADREWSRRKVLQLAALGGVSWLTPVAHVLAERAERTPGREPAQSLILLWLAGGPSQLETFDPHPGKDIAGGTTAIGTAVKGIQLAAGYERLAEQMPHASLVRSLVSKEGDHERGSYLVKTGYRPDPTVVHPSVGAICCHQLPVGSTEIPRHISILPNQWPGVGGMLGKQYDAFKCYDPAAKVPDVVAQVSDSRFQRRLDDLAVVEQAFARGRARQAEATLHRSTVENARKMMSSEQLEAFDVKREPRELQQAYGDTPFGRGCLAARRLIEVGVRCVEVTLSGWDSHANNHEIHHNLAVTLDAAIAALLDDLRQRDLLDKTVVLCGGEFGRTPQINRLQGRDHWPHGFSMLLAGGRLRGGVVIGATDPEGGREVESPQQVADLHATVLTALGIDPQHEVLAPVGRPIKFSEGAPIKQLLV
ncbi:MAG TPA: DUF1501 domain-containing protein [Pirellulales bacterium]|nr:DUF1501 domain-containing protein [Pirellulales bacterium]